MVAYSSARRSGARSAERSQFFLEILQPNSRIASESLPLPNALLALNLEVLGRGLATVGDLFVLDVLSFVECRKPSFLNCRNMNENVLAAVRGLDKPVTLGRVEPLHRTFSHSRRLRGIKKIYEPPVPAHTGLPEASEYAGCGGLGSANGIADSAKKRHIAPHFCRFAGFAVIWRGEIAAAVVAHFVSLEAD
jgi:hypothetical protein